MKKLLALILSLLTLSGCSAGSAGAFVQTDAKDAISRMNADPDHIILDVRTEEEFSQGHIPHALNIPLDRIGSEPLPQLPRKDQLILVYCRSGNRSKQAARALAEQGYTNIVEFGGIRSWPGDIVKD